MHTVGGSLDDGGKVSGPRTGVGIMQNQDDIRDRLIDAKVLWDNGRKAGAFVLALVALAGVSRRRYPKRTSPSVYFDKMREYHPNSKGEITAEERKQKAIRKKLKAEELSDSQAFKCMLLDLIEDIILPNPKPGVHPPKYNIRFPFGKSRKDTNIEVIFYKAFRNSFVHEGRFTSDAFLAPRTVRGDELHLTQPTGIPEAWIPNLLIALNRTPELT